jgi:hypothetical protein
MIVLGPRKGGLRVIDAAAPDDADLRAIDKQRCPLIGVSRTRAADSAKSEKCQWRKISLMVLGQLDIGHFNPVALACGD